MLVLLISSVAYDKVFPFWQDFVLDDMPVTLTLKVISVLSLSQRKFMTQSDGTIARKPHFLREGIVAPLLRSRNLSRCASSFNNRERKWRESDRLHERIRDSRSDFQWMFAHDLCRCYDTIILVDLVLGGMRRRWGRKICYLAHGDYVQILQYVATKYGVTVHKIGRFYVSSKTCFCGFVNNESHLSDRRWTCTACGMCHDRDLLAARNIHRQGIADWRVKVRPFGRRLVAVTLAAKNFIPLGVGVCQGCCLLSSESDFPIRHPRGGLAVGVHAGE